MVETTGFKAHLDRLGPRLSQIRGLGPGGLMRQVRGEEEVGPAREGLRARPDRRPGEGGGVSVPNGFLSPGSVRDAGGRPELGWPAFQRRGAGVESAGPRPDALDGFGRQPGDVFPQEEGGEAVKRVDPARDLRIWQAIRDGATLREVGDAHGLSRERIRQIHAKVSREKGLDRRIRRLPERAKR